MTEIEKLLAIEEIKQLKAKYFYYLDHKDWVNWREQVWAPEGKLVVAAEIDHTVFPREPMIEWVASRFADMVSVHHGHTPIIDIISETEAKALWAMEDRLYRGKGNPEGESFVLGFGHYHETYVKLEVGWRIRSTRLTRLRAETTSIT
jgi:hypothetical protein